MEHLLIRIKEYFSPLFSLIGGNFIVGGGSICDVVSSNTIKKDIDIFFENGFDRDEFRKRVEALGFKTVLETNFGVKYRFLNVNLDVTTWNQQRITEWASNSDFTVTSFMLNQDMTLYLHPEAIEDCTKGLLNPVNLRTNWNPRIFRYIEKGFTPTEKMLVYLDGLKLAGELQGDQRIEIIDLKQYSSDQRKIHLS